MSAPSQRTATLTGGTAVLMWGLLALFTTQTGAVPPLLLTALSFGIATGLISVKWLVYRDNVISHLRQPLSAWMVGVIGLFGSHFFYFAALRHAPGVEAGFIAYMWPLVIVLPPFCPANDCDGSTYGSYRRLGWRSHPDHRRAGPEFKLSYPRYVMAVCCA